MRKTAFPLSAPAATAALALTLSTPGLAQFPLAPYAGAPGSSHGAAMATGDLDGDGLIDVAIGAPTAAGGGAVTVQLGSGGTMSFAPTFGGGGYGTSVAIGDLDGDGIDDLVVGAPTEVTAPGNDGAVYIYRSLATPSVFRFTPGTTGESFGQAVAILPTLDGNGGGEVAVGAPTGRAIGGFPPTLSLQARGYVDVYDGATTGFLTSFGLVITPTTPTIGTTQIGRVLVGGDFDGDGEGDLGVGFLNLGTPGMAMHFSTSGAFVWPVPAVSAGTQFETNLADAAVNPGDRDGDGADELWYGNTSASSGMGQVVLRSILNQTQLIDRRGTSAGEALGTTVGLTGDFDGDGLGDLLAGAAVTASPEIQVVSGDWVSPVFSRGYGLHSLERTSAPTSLAGFDVDGNEWIDLLAGDAAADVVTVDSPGDTSLTAGKPTTPLALAGATYSNAEGGVITLFLNAGVANSGLVYGVVGDLQLTTDPLLKVPSLHDGSDFGDGVTFMESIPFYYTTLNNPTMLVASALTDPFNASGTALARIHAPANAFGPATPLPLNLYIAYGVVDLFGGGPLTKDASNIATITITP